jgi:hypothetical protein
MPYYDGRWHMFSEQERREFGESKRAEASKKWHAKWISMQGLKSDRLWTDKAILEFLGHPHQAGAIKASLLKDVQAAEKTMGFKNWMEKRRAWLVRREMLASKRVEIDQVRERTASAVAGKERMAISIDFERRQVELILAALTDKAAALERDVKRLAATDNKRANECQSDYFAVMEMVEETSNSRLRFRHRPGMAAMCRSRS